MIDQLEAFSTALLKNFSIFGFAGLTLRVIHFSNDISDSKDGICIKKRVVATILKKQRLCSVYIRMYIINKTQLQTPTDCFTPWGDHQGDLIQIE